MIRMPLLLNAPVIIRIADLQKRYATRSGETVHALSNINLEIRAT